jgi:hypothetical protein
VVWAREFCRITGFADESWAISWFCNAIMAGFDEANRRAAPLPASAALQALIDKQSRAVTGGRVMDELANKHWAEAAAQTLDIAHEGDRAAPPTSGCKC